MNAAAAGRSRGVRVEAGVSRDPAAVPAGTRVMAEMCRDRSGDKRVESGTLASSAGSVVSWCVINGSTVVKGMMSFCLQIKESTRTARRGDGSELIYVLIQSKRTM